MKEKKGFTLVELLAVIVILAILILLALPNVIKIMNTAKKNAAIDAVNGYIRTVKTQMVANEINEDKKIIDGSYSVADLEEKGVSMTGDAPTDGTLTIASESVTYGCIDISGYAVTVTDGLAVSAVKGTCDANASIAIGETKAIIEEINTKISCKTLNNGDYTIKNLTSLVCEPFIETFPTEGKVNLKDTKVSSGCIQKGEYAVTITNGVAKSAKRGTCNTTITDFATIADSNPGIVCGDSQTEDYANNPSCYIKSVEDLVALSNLVASGTNFMGKQVYLSANLDFNNNNSYVDSSSTSFGDINEDGSTTSIKDELTNTSGHGLKSIGLNSSSAFWGEFNGQGYTLENFYQNGRNGLFGYTTNGASISNLIVNNSTLTNYNNSGVILGYGNNGTGFFNNVVKNSTINSAGENHFIGGAVGYLTSCGQVQNNIISNVNVNGFINTNNNSGSTDVGGFAGYLSQCNAFDINISNTNVKGYLNVGTLTGTTTSAAVYGININNSSVQGISYIGGLSGVLLGTFKNANINTLSVNSEGYAGGAVADLLGSVIGLNGRKITVKSNGTHNNNIGGIAAVLNSGANISYVSLYDTIIESNNSATYAGGIAGSINAGVVNNTLFSGKITFANSTQTFGLINLGGIIGKNDETEKGSYSNIIINSAIEHKNSIIKPYIGNISGSEPNAETINNFYKNVTITNNFNSRQTTYYDGSELSGNLNDKTTYSGIIEFDTDTDEDGYWFEMSNGKIKVSHE